MNVKDKTINAFVSSQNTNKLLFTAGPASLLAENITGLRPCFGRGDNDYAAAENRVLAKLTAMSGHAHTIRLQGSASLAMEIMALNFLYGKVLIVSTGYYSDRLQWLAESALRRVGEVKEVVTVNWREIENVTGNFDWVCACYTETSCGLKLPIAALSGLAKRVGSRLMLDATASIGLEGSHDQAEVIGYSSCKGLFGLTGAAFIAFNDLPNIEIDSFYLRLSTHIERLMTGPYHAICSLVDVLSRHTDVRMAVVENKRVFMNEMQAYLSNPPSHQPLLCTHVTCDITSRDPRAVLYKPRSNAGGSVVCHLGEAHLGETARAEILEVLEITPQVS